jgi:hypothetical protein
MIDAHMYAEYDLQINKYIDKTAAIGPLRNRDTYIKLIETLKNNVQSRILSNIPSLSDLASSHYLGCGHHGYGHPREPAHEELAQRIYQEIVVC